jgi:hypothetical protein
MKTATTAAVHRAGPDYPLKLSSIKVRVCIGAPALPGGDEDRGPPPRRHTRWMAQCRGQNDIARTPAWCENTFERVSQLRVNTHGFHLADAWPKLKGLARYAETHWHVYRRIEAVAKVGSQLRMLDLTRAEVRQAVAAAENAEDLYRSAAAGDYL